MNEIWKLPYQKEIGGTVHRIHVDYRDILEIFSYFDDPDLPDYLKWKIGIALFYEGEIPGDCFQEAAEYLAFFIRCGQPEMTGGAPRLIDWQQDAPAILADMNRVAGTEIRSLPFLHWWTFMAWFHGLGEGQLSSIISLRQKLRKGQKLEPWERDFYRENKLSVDMKRRFSRQELQEQKRIKMLLGDEMLDKSR